MMKELNVSKVQGEVTAPPSKSYGHRALIALALSKGKGVVSPVDLSMDIMATLKCLEDLGVDFFIRDKEVHMDARGFGIRRDRVLKPEESGSTLRFFIPITLLFDEVYEFRGSTSLMKRPLTVYEELFQNLDVTLYRDSMESLVVKGKLEPGHFSMRGDVSSQFVSGMLFVLPLLDGDSTLSVTGTLESAGYVEMTLKVMEDFGVFVEKEGNTFFIKGNQTYAARDYEVEGDYSQAAFFMAAAALAGEVRIIGLRHDSLQGDREIVRILGKMGAEVRRVEDGYQVKKSDLIGLDVDICNIPDLTPVLGVLLSLSKGGGRLKNCRRLRYKESNRVESTIELIKSLGGKAELAEDDILIEGSSMLRGGEVDAYYDHRIVMASAVAALRCEGLVTINGYEAVNKSYPDFFRDFSMLTESEETYLL